LLAALAVSVGARLGAGGVDGAGAKTHSYKRIYRVSTNVNASERETGAKCLEKTSLD